MVTVNATLNSSDATSGVESVVLTSITSNEPDSGQGDIQARFRYSRHFIQLTCGKITNLYHHLYGNR